MIIKTDFEKLEAELLEESKFFDAPEDILTPMKTVSL